MSGNAQVFELRIREPEIDSKVIIRLRGNSWHGALYVGNDIFVLSDGVKCKPEDITHYIEEPSWQYVDFQKIARLRRMMTITEKLDGANVKIEVDRYQNINVGGHNGPLTLDFDPQGFARWAYDHTDELRTLGPGRHFGEWWGPGIGKRKYPVPERRLSMFNVHIFAAPGTEPKLISAATGKMQTVLPPCCGLVPVLYTGVFDTQVIDAQIERLRRDGSVAVPGFMRPEGVVVFHDAANMYFKRTLAHDDIPKSLVVEDA